MNGMTVTEKKVFVDVTYSSRGYVGRSPDLRAPVVALSLDGLRRKIEVAMLPDEVTVMLQLDKAARLECDARHRGGVNRAGDARLR